MKEKRNVLIIYYSKHGTTRKLAEYISIGIEKNSVNAVIRTVPNINNKEKKYDKQLDHSIVSLEDVKKCSGIILGSPCYFGNMAAPLKHYIDQTTDIWINGLLVNKPAAVFCSSSSMHGGQETTLVSMMFPLLHHGAILVGVPFFKTHLMHTAKGGSPYGPTHVNDNQKENQINEIEKKICISLGKRVSDLVVKIKK